MLDFVADTTKIGLETQQHLLHPCENSITALDLRDRKMATKAKQNRNNESGFSWNITAGVEDMNRAIDSTNPHVCFWQSEQGWEYRRKNERNG